MIFWEPNTGKTLGGSDLSWEDLNLIEYVALRWSSSGFIISFSNNSNMSENGTSPKIAVCFDRKMMMNHEISRHHVFRQTKHLNQLR